MDDLRTLVVLLSIAVLILTVVIVAVLVVLTLALVKLNHIAKNVEAVTTNVASASEWLSPVKIISVVTDMFRK